MAVTKEQVDVLEKSFTALAQARLAEERAYNLYREEQNNRRPWLRDTRHNDDVMLSDYITAKRAGKELQGFWVSPEAKTSSRFSRCVSCCRKKFS